MIIQFRETIYNYNFVIIYIYNIKNIGAIIADNKHQIQGIEFLLNKKYDNPSVIAKKIPVLFIKFISVIEFDFEL